MRNRGLGPQGTPTHFRHWWRRGIPGVMCGLIGIGALAADASASTPVANSQIQHGKAFYKGKTVNFLVDGSIGGSSDQWARALAPYVGTYLHATVNVVDPAASVSTQAYNNVIGAAPGTGLYVGYVHLANWISGAILGVPQANYNVVRDAWITSQGGSTDVLYENSTFGDSLQQVIKDYGPGSSTPVKVLDGNPSAATNLETRSFMGILGINANYIRGYTSSGSELAGFIRGDAPFFITGLDQAGALLAAGKAKALAITVKPLPGALYGSLVRDVPTFSQAFAQYAPKSKLKATQIKAIDDILNPPTNAAIIMPTSVTADKVAAMRAAFQWAYTKPALRTLLRVTDGLPDNFVQPVKAKTLFAQSLKLDKALKPYDA